jgi:hypothetical protein
VVVHLALVEKVRLHGGRIMPDMCAKGEKPFSSGLKGLESGVREPSLQRARGLMVMPCRAGTSATRPLRSPATVATTRHPGSPGPM